MTTRLDVTDQAIHEAFERRARGATAQDLYAPILARTASIRQDRSWGERWRAITGQATPVCLLALAILIGALLMVGLAAVGSRPVTPEPTPTPAPLQSAAVFARPFEYRIPAGSDRCEGDITAEKWIG